MRLSDKLFILVPMLVTVLRGQTPDYPYVFKQIARRWRTRRSGAALQPCGHSVGSLRQCVHPRLVEPPHPQGGAVSTFAELKLDGASNWGAHKDALT